MTYLNPERAALALKLWSEGRDTLQIARVAELEAQVDGLAAIEADVIAVVASLETVKHEPGGVVWIDQVPVEQPVAAE